MASLLQTLRALAVVSALLVGVGCNNDCQTLCEEMANYWQDCNLSFGDAEVSDCKDAFTSTSTEDGGNAQYDSYKSACRQLIASEENADGERMMALRARFTCEDMAAGPGGAFGGGNSGDGNR